MGNESTPAVAQTEQEGQVVGRVSGLEGGKFLTFLMAKEKYGLEILKVREIIGMMEVTSVPRTPDFVAPSLWSGAPPVLPGKIDFREIP